MGRGSGAADMPGTLRDGLADQVIKGGCAHWRWRLQEHFTSFVIDMNSAPFNRRLQRRRDAQNQTQRGGLVRPKFCKGLRCAHGSETDDVALRPIRWIEAVDRRKHFDQRVDRRRLPLPPPVVPPIVGVKVPGAVVDGGAWDGLLIRLVHDELLGEAAAVLAGRTIDLTVELIAYRLDHFTGVYLFQL